MSLHKLSAGGGYTYLTKQVVRLDAQGVRGGDLGGYYSDKGETPGRWLGSALLGLGQAPLAPGITAGDVVTEAQMLALFGEGRHPQDEAIRQSAVAGAATPAVAERAGRLGRAFPTMAPLSGFRTRCAAEYQAAGCTDQTAAHEQQRAVIRTQVATEMFTDELGRAPVDGRELNGFIIRSTRRPAPVAGYDLTFSPVKSVSTLWALAPVPTARVIEAAHDAAVRDSLAWLEAQACFTRLGRGGVRQVETTGLLATGFTHRDTRSGDPDLHTHVAISNKVQTTPADGSRWLALDGRVLHKAAVAASERYNTRLEAELRDRLGVAFVERAQTDPRKRTVREIAGVDPGLMRAWSSRRAAIDVARAVLEQGFQSRHGRPPTPAESIKLAQEANLATRAAKHEPRSEADQRTQWRAEALTTLAGGRTDPGSRARALEQVEQVLTHAQDEARTVRAAGATEGAGRGGDVDAPTPEWVQQSARAVIATVQSCRATWQQWHVIAETQRVIRGANIAPAAQADAEAKVLAAALGPGHNVALGRYADDLPGDVTSTGRAAARGGVGHQGARSAGAGLLRSDPPPICEPAALRRTTGESVYEVAGMTHYTSAAVLAAEQRILALAGQGGARSLSVAEVDLALLESTANGRELNPAQAQMVREFTTSGARVQLAIAPAGSGKTTATSVLARAWTSSGGHVIGLTPTAAAASVLADQTGSTCDTLAKLVYALGPADLPPHTQTGRRTPPRMPDWADRVGPDTLVVVDEAGMASTTDLDVALGWLAGRGAVVRLVGDDQQLASVSCGGVLRDIATTHGALTLSELMRFHDPGEGSASLAVRAGDRTAIAFWLDNDRVTVGGARTMIETTYRQWAGDVAGGVDSIMLAPRRDVVADLNAQARTERLARLEAHPTPVGPQAGAEAGLEVGLPDGNRASAGDVVITRRNARELTLSGTDYVRNGYRWTITTVHDDGSVTVASTRPSGRAGAGRAVVRLPAAYVAEHLELGYATTIHAAQGVTADRCRLLADDTLDRQLLYVGTTRGRQTNTINLIVVGDGDPHDQTTPAAVHPHTATEILERIVARDGSQVSATTRRRDTLSPQRRLAPAAARYLDALGVAAQDVADPQVMAGLDAHVDVAHPGLRDDPAWAVLRARLALVHLRGRDPVTALDEAAGTVGSGVGGTVGGLVAGDSCGSGRGRGFGDARDVAAVLDWRLRDHHDGDLAATAAGGVPAPLPWLPAVPAVLADHPRWGHYLRARAAWTGMQAGSVLDQVAAWSPDTAPAWVGALGLAHDDPVAGALAVWRYTHDVDDHDVRATGDPRFDVTSARHQAQLERDVATARGPGQATSGILQEFVQGLDPRIVADPTWRSVEVRLQGLARAGVDVPTAITTALTSTGFGHSQSDVPGARRGLPDDMPAAALWWRISRATDPAALAGRAPAYRPAWFDVLVEDLGQHRADRVAVDPAWTSVLAAVNHAQRHGLDPQQIVHVAAELTEPARAPARGGIADPDLARALTVRITALTWAADEQAASTTADTAPDQPGTTGPAEHTPQPPGHDPRRRPDESASDLETRRWVSSDDVVTDDPQDVDPPGQSQHLDRDAPPVSTDGPVLVGPQEQVPWPSEPPAQDDDVVDEGLLDQAQLRTLLEIAAVDRRVVQAMLEAAPDGGTPAPAAAATGRPVADTVLSQPGLPRLRELNAAAAVFYTDQLPGTWAQDYLDARLGTRPADRAGTGVPPGAGYAPAGWTHLVDHLRDVMKATDTELVDAGLARTTSRGTLIDAFRDRVVLPLLEPATAGAGSTRRDNAASVEVVGFVARRNPAHDRTGEHPDTGTTGQDQDRGQDQPAGTDRFAGPKYLNTCRTALYDKGSHLYGLTDLLNRPGAVPVIVEGPFDAEAVTTAGNGAYVGVAALGTALTDAQVTRLVNVLRPQRTRTGRQDDLVLVATDPDAAGRRAAAAAYTLLSSHGLPQAGAVDLPEGSDPALILQDGGPAALRAALDSHRPLVDTLIDHLACAHERFDPRQVHAARAAGALIGAQPPHRWAELAERAAAATGVHVETALHITLEAARARTDELRDRRPRKWPPPSAVPRVAPKAGPARPVRSNPGRTPGAQPGGPRP